MKDRVAVVTGASRGIGLEVARLLVSQECRVALVARSEGTLQQALAAVSSAGAEPLAVVADVADQEQVKTLFKTVAERWGTVDFLVNCAGITRDRLVLRMNREDWDSVLATTKWNGRKLAEIQLHPITLGFGQPRSTRGRPKLAGGADATRILEMMTARSKAFGTTVVDKNGIGIITP